MFNLLKMDTFVPATARDGRGEPRHPTAVSVTLSCPKIGMFAGMLIDLSVHGARLRAQPRVRVDTPMLLEIEGMPLLSGTIIWAEGHELGLCFDQPLHPVVLDHLIEQSGVNRA